MQTPEEKILGMLRRLHAISRRQNRQLSPAPDGEQIPHHSRPQGLGRLVSFLMDNGPMGQCQIAERMEIRPQSLSELLTRAESEGLVLRQQSEKDKRQTVVSLTEKGVESVEVFRCAHRKHAEEFLAPLNTEEKAQLSLLLEKLLEGKCEKDEMRNNG